MSSDGDVPMMDAESQSQDIDFIQILANMKTEVFDRSSE